MKPNIKFIPLVNEIPTIHMVNNLKYEYTNIKFNKVI